LYISKKEVFKGKEEWSVESEKHPATNVERRSISVHSKYQAIYYYASCKLEASSAR